MCRPSQRVTIFQDMVLVILEEGAIRRPDRIAKWILEGRHKDFRGLNDSRVMMERKAQNPSVHVEGQLNRFASCSDRVWTYDGSKCPSAIVEDPHNHGPGRRSR